MTATVTPRCILVASRSTQGEGKFVKARWTELNLYYDPEPAERSETWLSERIGRSSIAGETDYVTVLGDRTMAAAIRRFKDGAPARSIAEQAEAFVAAGKLPKGIGDE